MKTKYLASTVLVSALTALLALPLDSHARSTLPVVYNYDLAEQSGIWEGIGRNSVPQSMLATVDVADPALAFRAPYSRVFLQNQRLVVCADDCNSDQNLTPAYDGSDFAVQLLTGKSKRIRELNESIIRQATVYFWVNRLFDYLEELNYAPSHRLTIRVDRHVRSIESGHRFENNAFFNDKDWSLSFLPAGHPLLMRLLGQTPRPSGYDPTVAIHEATHSVFEDLIGPILNSEIYGLHEAFADYFAMSIIGTAKIGQVMLGGQSIRDASKVLEYERDMEAHDLGQVVASALWAIRANFGDKKLADGIALETIRTISMDPFASAGDVVTAHASALERLGQGELSSRPALRSEIQKIWAKSKLIPRSIEIDTSPIKAPVLADSWLVNSFQITLPDWAVTSYGLPKTNASSLGVISVREGAPGTRWYLISLESLKETKTIWILYSEETGSILAAYDLYANPISRENDELYSVLLSAGPEIGQLFTWKQDFAEDLRDLFHDTGKMRSIYKRGKLNRSERIVAINGDFFEAQEVSFDLKRTLGAKIIGIFLGSEVRATLKAPKSVRFVTISSAESPDLASRLVELEPGRLLVGYEMELRTGLKTAILIEQVK